MRSRWFTGVRFVGLAAFVTTRLVAQRVDPTVTLTPPEGKTRIIDFETDEGTDMSVSVSPDGTWLAFDLLGQVYRLPIGGGRATALTENSGNALNFHPAISPDGKRIAFISDRQGQNNVWVMAADGSDPRPIYLDPETRFTEPAWSADGKSIAAVRAFSTLGRGWHRQVKELWLLPLGGGKPRVLLKGRLEHYEAPQFSRDGKFLYYHVSYSMGDGLSMLLAGHRVQRLDLATGKRENLRTKDPTALSPEFVKALKSGGYSADLSIDPPAALAPVVSPDGSMLAFALEEPGQNFSYRGHQFGPRTALYVRRLDSGQERSVIAPITKELTQTNAQYYYRVIPGFSWFPDGKSVGIAFGGKLHRIDVATGEDHAIPFSARVHRVLAEQPRSALKIRDSTVAVTFIQWPSGSPDGKHVAFVAAGKVWVMDLPNGKPRPLTDDQPGSIQLTPAWSPDGTEIAFTSWNETDRGALWKASAAGGRPTRLTREPGEYIYPAWSADGKTLAVTKGPGPKPPESWEGWSAEVGWGIVRLAADRADEPARVASSGSLQSASFGADGRIYFATAGDQPLPYATGYYPVPPPEIANRELKVRSAGPDGVRDEVRFPAEGLPTLGRPVLSPDGRWVAFESDRAVYVRPMAKPGGKAPLLSMDPNVADPARTKVTELAGLYQSWRDRETLQFASGNQYVTFKPSTKKVEVFPIRLDLPRPVPTGSIALTNAKIITMTDSGTASGVIGKGTVVISGARITCVGTCDASRADRVIDASGKVIIPGLVDLHAHHTSDQNGITVPKRWQSALDLAYGVTTIIDPATESESALPLAQMVDAGVTVGPRTYSSTEVVIWPGRAWGENKKIYSSADAQFEIGRRQRWGALEIKNYRQSSRRQHQLIIGAARKLGITVTSEGGPLFFDVGLTLDGQTGWEHFVAALPLYKDATTFFGKAGMVYSPTSIVAGHPHGSMQYYRPLQHLLDDPKYNRFIPRSVLEWQHRAVRPFDISELSFPIVAEGMKDIIRAGGYGVIGEHGEQIGIGSHWEVWGYATAMTPLEALKVATWDGAYFVGLQDQIGSISVGKLADLIVLNSDPLNDIKNTADIQYVMKHGILYDDDTLDEVWPTKKAFGASPWK